MKLDELKKKLYKPEADFEERLQGPEVFQLEKQREKKVVQEWQPIEKKQIPPQKKKKILIIGISLAVVFMAVAGFFIWRGFTSFDKNKVELEINGAERVVSGEEIKYTVKYKNKTRLALENIKLVFHYPEGSIPTNQNGLDETIELSDLAVGQEQEIELLVRLTGLKDENKKAWAELIYQPVSLSSNYTNQTEFISQIISVPLILDFDLPEKLVAGQSFDFSLRYLNQAEIAFDNLQIQIEYPQGFVFQSASPSASENDQVWSLGKLMAGQQGKIFIQGEIEGEQEETKSFKAQLGLLEDDEFIPYAETVAALRISNSPLFVSQTVNNSTSYITKAGDQLNYKIDYKNTTNQAIKDVVITSKIEGSALDLTSFELDQGSFDGASQTITWKASNLPALAYLGPQQQGQIDFSVKVKDNLPISNYNDKNFKVINTVKIDSSEKPVSLGDIEISGQSQLITKIASQVTLQSQGYYYDDLISNSGPIPPQVGQTTSYTIKWRLINTSNDLENVKVTAFLPPHVKWNSKVNPGFANISYSSQTGKVIWTVGDLPSATGLLLPVKEVVFQISITPSLANLNNLVELIGQSQVTGQDSFVNLELTNTDKSIDTDLPDDLKVSRQQGTVVQ